MNNHCQLNVLFFGTADFAVPSLVALAESDHNILAVVTQPDKPSGRGNRVTFSPVKVAAQELSLPVLQPKRVRSPRFIEKVREMNPDVIALAAFGQIIPQELLVIPRLGPINVHGSLLPELRGAAPIQWSILRGDRYTGVTTMWMEPSLDTGDILQKSTVAIDNDDTTQTLTLKLAQAGALLLLDTLTALHEGTAVRTPQDHVLATIAPAIQPTDGVINWSDSAWKINCRVRAMVPKPGCTAEINGKKVKVWQTATTEINAHNCVPGTLLSIAKDRHSVVVAAGEGTAIHLLEVQPESGKRMPADAWARGLRLQPGDHFSFLST